MTTPHGTTQQYEGTPISVQEASHDYDGPDGAFQAIEDLTQLMQAQFRTHKPSSFYDSANQWAAETWINQIAIIFTVLRLYMLTGEAYKWWQITRPLLLEAEFATVEQGTDTVVDYVARFTRLYRFSQPFPEDKKTKKLTRGFKPSVRNLLSVQGLPSYAQAIDCGCTSDVNKGQDAREGREQRKRTQSEGQSSDALPGRFRKRQGFSFGGSYGSSHNGY
ncbi:unnamed protein product [Malus baccata var. baccata]